MGRRRDHRRSVLGWAAIFDDFNVVRDPPKLVQQKWRGHVLLRYLAKSPRRNDVSPEVVEALIDESFGVEPEVERVMPAVEATGKHVVIVNKGFRKARPC